MGYKKLIILFMFILPASAFSWTAPIGIPSPSWPTDLDVARPTMPNPWTSEQVGWYFIQSSGCSDSRTYGIPSSPRCSLPQSPAAGTKVVLSGSINFSNIINANGTAQNPVWFMGYNTESRPTIVGVDNEATGYVIFDNINFNGNGSRGGFNIGDYVMVRNCNFTNSYSAASYAAIIPFGNTAIIYNCVFGPVGNWLYSGSSDIDCHGIKVYTGTTNLWVVDNTFFHCEGDGIQVGDQSYYNISNIYIGRNEAYENLQSCFWVKTGDDVIISENLCHDIAYGEGAAGQGMGAQYDDVSYVWFMANTIHDVWSGIKIAGGAGGPYYAIGNLLYDIQSSMSNCGNDGYDLGGLNYQSAGTGGATFIFNTLYNVDVFVSARDGYVTARNNIFSVRSDTSCSVNYGSYTHDYNLYSSSSYDPGTEAHRQIEAASSTFNNPGTDFSIKAGSLAIDHSNPTEEAVFAAFQSRYGIDIRKDILGAARPATAAAWDIGAYEYDSGTTPAPPTKVRIIMID